MKKPVIRSEAEKSALVKKVTEGVKVGQTVAQASKAAGVSYSNYYAWKSAKPRRRVAKTPQLITLPLAPANQIVILMGDPSQVNAALERLALIGGR